ncbi:SRPBCC family protein [Salarchaeum sp. III]|uniref:SRPBCC family protein n=1 Tax=Salarchaeum sp. III TaxID=3107927 RepID=UPI002EDA1810
MTVRVERTFDLDAPPADVWAFISDPTRRASAISVVDSFEQDGDVTTWHVRVPVVNRTIPVETRDVEREDGEYVKFVGKSKVLRVTGEHRIEPREDGGTRLHNAFVVDGRLPGVERFFERNLDEELDNLKERLDG